MSTCGVSLLGSTGSIGQSTLKIIETHPELFHVVALSAYQNIDLLFEQCCRFKPRFAVVVHPEAAKVFKAKCQTQGLSTTVLVGQQSLCEIASLSEVTKVVAGITGVAGLASVVAAVKASKHVLLANKESLVSAGECLVRLAQKHNALLLPTDSEHNALFQCLPSDYTLLTRPKGVKRLILTASGGPFLNTPLEEFKHVTPEAACRHPTWKMGKKITVDSATLMNKGLEVIEACRFFQLPPECVDVIVHPQSIVHSMVEYVDGSNLAQLGTPDMQIPIAYCLSWPKRIPTKAKRLSLTEVGKLTFFPPDEQKFKCLALAQAALRLGKAAPTVLNASNEIAVQAFLRRELRFPSIPTIIEKVLDSLFDLSATTLEEVILADRLAREKALQVLQLETE